MIHLLERIIYKRIIARKRVLLNSAAPNSVTHLPKVLAMALTKCWDPEVILFRKNEPKNVIMIPNQPVTEDVVDFLKATWNRAALRMCVDGGAETLVRIMGCQIDNFLPDYITGDFDSVSKETLKSFQAKGTTIVHTPDQDETDFTKALRVLKQAVESKALQIDHVVVLCSSFDRVDHMMAHFNTLFTSMAFLHVPVCLYSGSSLTWLLGEGRHQIATPKHLVGEWCGLIPLGEPCREVTTTGLKWNLNHSEMRFGGMVSTSNTFDASGVVTVETDKPLLWTMGIAPAKV